MLQSCFKVPSDITEHYLVKLTADSLKSTLLPYLKHRSIKKESTGQFVEFNLDTIFEGRKLSANITSEGESVELNNVHLDETFDGILPLSTRHTILTSIFQKMTGSSIPSSCVIEADNIKTFGGMNYTYPLNECEHIVFTEQSADPRVVVSVVNNHSIHMVIMIVDGHKYKLEFKYKSKKKKANTQKVSVTVNGEEKEWISPRYQKQQRQHKQKHEYQYENKFYQTLKQNVYEDMDTIVTDYQDGVFSIIARKYGVTVMTDGKRLKLESYPFIFQNKITGLCGELNGENAVNIKSARQCILPSSRLSALTFMIPIRGCGKIMKHEKNTLNKFQQKCLQPKQTLTRVYSLLQPKTRVNLFELKHIVEVNGQHTCFSKSAIYMCTSSYPKEVTTKRVPFTCFLKPKSEQILDRVEKGELVEELQHGPANFMKTVYEPTKC